LKKNLHSTASKIFGMIVAASEQALVGNKAVVCQLWYSSPLAASLSTFGVSMVFSFSLIPSTEYRPHHHHRYFSDKTI
jgi:hypothetical protein